MTDPGTPTLVVRSGPPRTGKTTLGHTIARAVSCPAVCRDEIKEGMVHAAYAEFDRLSLPVPSLDVDTTHGYVPDLASIVAFVNDG